MPRRYWLFKSEPLSFSIDDLKNSKDETASWDGVRNYQARNYLRDSIKMGDGVLFYHSSSSEIGIVGEAVVVREGYPDPSAFDPTDRHYDSKSSADLPIWFTLDIKLVRKSEKIIPLNKLRSIRSLTDMKLLQRGMRLSVQPVTSKEWTTIMKLAEWTK
ncbi:MAG: EVE domain-containing protein [Nitrospiria bacterium]